jgi:hypothetical protein
MSAMVHRDGLSLLETVTALAVTSTILLGIGSAMLLAGRALPDTRSPTAQTVAGAEALESVVAELRYAVAINQRAARLIEFTVADRSGDTTPEVIRYEWSGTAGDPLTRRYNAGASVDVLADVREFSLTYDLQTISTEILQTNESAETLLIGYDCSLDYADYSIKELEWYSEYFRPTLPVDAVSWKVTRVRFTAKQAGSLGGETRIQLRTPTAGGLPSGIVLEEKTFYESILPLLYLVQEVTYTQVSGLSPQQGLCLVFRWQADAEACKLLGRNKNVAAADIALLKSTDKGVSWTSLAAQSLLFSVYGTVTTAGTPQIQNRYYLNALTVRLKAGADDQATVQTSVRMLNQPEVSQ